ncbi:LysR family transcriptional regulator, cyn operon transcriptional activator [Paraburkholderia phenazinium]|jgi:LysR family cyn operon transcriptional activator|uniref:LysR family transcriptional regulator, cyn operon transcriptional activator n=2 Tax=Paraburkholderia phenazinium TaxID=60549 RepID=A0A1N6KMN7_9BURK|nr:LysR family transcriptional regulator, cyn operon transcriptional activator [Paraburkholderia phenazinium]
MNLFSYRVQDRIMMDPISHTYSWVFMLLRHIRYLQAVAEHQNFTRAAEALHVSQPTLSQQIRQLEDLLHVQLLDRSGRTVRVTDAGEAYLRHARRALQDLDAGRRAIDDVQDLSRGTLRLAVTPTFTAYLIGPLLARFNERYPGITVNLEETTQDRIEAALAADLLDIGIAFDEIRSPDIESEVLFVETLSLVVGAAHRCAAQTAPLAVRDMERESLVLLSGEFATRRYIDLYCRQQRIAPRVAIEVNSLSAVVEIVRRGQLATVLPDAIAREHEGLHPVALKPALPRRTAVLLRRSGAYRSAASEAFAALAAAFSESC